MWKINREVESEDQIWKCRLLENDQPVSYEQVIQLWQHDERFNSWFVEQLLENTWSAARWETPYLTVANLSRPFEFTMVNSPGLQRNANDLAFCEHFGNSEAETVVSFSNLGRNGTMIVPTPAPSSNGDADFCHLLSFLRTAN